MRFQRDIGQWAGGGVVWAIVGVLAVIVLLYVVINILSGNGTGA